MPATFKGYKLFMTKRHSILWESASAFSLAISLFSKSSRFHILITVRNMLNLSWMKSSCFNLPKSVPLHAVYILPVVGNSASHYCSWATARWSYDCGVPLFAEGYVETRKKQRKLYSLSWLLMYYSKHARKQKTSVIKQLTQATYLILNIKPVSFSDEKPDYH